MATMSATVTGWAVRAQKAWFPSSGVSSVSSTPSGVNAVASCPTTSSTSTTSSNNKYTVMIAVTMPSGDSIGSITGVSISFRVSDSNSTAGYLYGSLRTVSQSNGSTSSDTISTYRANAVGDEASVYGIGTSASSQTMSFSGSFTQGQTYYLFLYTKNTTDIYNFYAGSSYYSCTVTYSTKTYAIQYNANGGTGAPATHYKTYGVATTISSTKPTKANASAGSYTVTFNANGGSCSTASLNAARTTKYTFSKWNTNSSGTGTSYSSGASYTTNAALYLYAIYTSSTSTSAITLPTPTRDGYTFMGWATRSTATSGTTGSYTPTGAVTLYAIWAAKGLIYIDNGSSMDAYQVYIDNGTSWDLYAPHIDNGSSWDLCS